MLTIRDQQMRQMAVAQTNKKMVQPCPETQTWIEIRLIDENDEPVPGARYRLHLPDGAIMEGALDDGGLARVDQILPGSCCVEFPEIDSREWRPA
jgi:hypothetical protein